ncbi:MAG: lysylphosphatidylglycerol synthase domain-containing protein, partial [Rudaea sp.]
LVVLFAANLLGLQLPLSAAVLVLAVSGLAGGISLLPAGTGAVETTMAGLLVVLGATLPNAIAITLLARLSTLWLWVALGLALAFILRVPNPRLAFQGRRIQDNEQLSNQRKLL